MRDLAEQASEDLALATVTALAPPEDFVPPELVGKPVLMVVVAWLGDPADAEDAVRPVRQLTAGGVDLVQPMPYTAVSSRATSRPESPGMRKSSSARQGSGSAASSRSASSPCPAVATW